MMHLVVAMHPEHLMTMLMLKYGYKSPTDQFGMPLFKLSPMVPVREGMQMADQMRNKGPSPLILGA